MQDSEQYTSAPTRLSSAYRYSSADLAAVNRAALPEGPALPAAVEAVVAHQLENVQGQQPSVEWLFTACKAGDLKLVRELLVRGANVNAARTVDGCISLKLF